MRRTSGSSILERGELEQQALAQVARRDAGRVELLDLARARASTTLLAHAGLARDLLDASSAG